jgi:hypothetical protein
MFKKYCHFIFIALLLSLLVACKENKIYIDEAKEIVGTCVIPKVPYGAFHMAHQLLKLNLLFQNMV